MAASRAATSKPGVTKTLVMAGTSKDIADGRFVGYDGERNRYVGEKFYWYGEKLPSWVRIKDGKGGWVDVKTPGGAKGRRAGVRRAHPATAPGQAPKQRLRELEDDEMDLFGVKALPAAEEPEPPASGRASDASVG
ncbi:MAG TPA: hypothetical protein VFH61_04805 [Thermoleophilia bacterium]|nr:hypothetical protein [Thermoleophilia bacterium]